MNLEYIPDISFVLKIVPVLMNEDPGFFSCMGNSAFFLPLKIEIYVPLSSVTL